MALITRVKRPNVTSNNGRVRMSMMGRRKALKIPSSNEAASNVMKELA